MCEEDRQRQQFYYCNVVGMMDCQFAIVCKGRSDCQPSSRERVQLGKLASHFTFCNAGPCRLLCVRVCVCVYTHNVRRTHTVE